MAGYQGLLPRGDPGIDLGPELVGFLVEFEDLLFQIDIAVGREEGKLFDLLFKIGNGFFEFQIFLGQGLLPMGSMVYETKYRSGFPAPVSFK